MAHALRLVEASPDAPATARLLRDTELASTSSATASRWSSTSPASASASGGPAPTGRRFQARAATRAAAVPYHQLIFRNQARPAFAYAAQLQRRRQGLCRLFQERIRKFSGWPGYCFLKKTVIPAPDKLDKVCKDPKFRKEVRSNPYMYKGNLVLQTGQELLTVSLDIDKNLEDVTLPFLVLHGEDDVVADPEGSRLLYEQTSSRKKIRCSSCS